MAEGWAAAAEGSGDELLVQLVERSPLPIAVVDLDTLDYVAVSRAGVALLGLADDDDLPNVLDTTGEPDEAREAFGLIQRGAIDGYEARRHVRRPDHRPQSAALAVRALQKYGFPGRALVLVTATAPGDDAPELPRLDPTEPDVCAGSTDEDGRIDRISPEIESLLGLRDELNATTFVARVHPDDVLSLSEALALTSSARIPVSLNVRLPDREGQWTTARLVVAADEREAEPRLGFALTREQTSGSPSEPNPELRVEELERTLTRISNEIQALGLAPRMALLPSGEELPELEHLSARQWEIVSRLLAGERVPSIARSMFLSQSTIRNHLSAVFAKLGVHSQQELIELIRARSSAPPSDS